MKEDVLLEIRIENIPARFITSAEDQLRKYITEYAEEYCLEFESLETYGTYKRLVLCIHGVPDYTGEKVQKYLGPAANLLMDKDGNYTRQAIGFAKGKGTTPDKLETTDDPKKGKVLCFVKKTPGIRTEKALAEIFPKIITRLQFPKTMVWEASRMKFARPIRGIVAMRGTKSISFSIAGIKAGKTTEGLNSLGSPKIVIEKADKYLETLRKNNVIASDLQRREMLYNGLQESASAMNLSADIDDDLLTENVYLTEYPVCVAANYSQEFLKLPKELVHLVMKKQLKFFTMSDKKGNLAAYFIGIRDGISKGQQNVEEGFRNVLEARFRDAIFFYERDLAIPLDDFRAKLSSVTFQEKLGTMADRAERTEKIASWLADNAIAENGAVPDKDSIRKAAHHVYSDLTSNLVREFTELQGVIGGYYAANAGLGKKAADSVGQFYFPMTAESPVPDSVEACLVSIAGKTDTLVSDFSLGLVPSGSEDPHGLRRQALGIVRIMLEKGISIPLSELFRYAFSLLPECASSRDVNVPMDFLWQRAELIFSSEGFAFDEIKSVKGIFMHGGNLMDCEMRLNDLNSMRGNPEFAAIAALFKRAKNILKNVKESLDGNADIRFFSAQEEKELYSALEDAAAKCSPLIKEQKYGEALSALLPVKPALDNFFLKVMVMDNDPEIRRNRLNLVKKITLLAGNIADLSMLQ